MKKKILLLLTFVITFIVGFGLVNASLLDEIRSIISHEKTGTKLVNSSGVKIQTKIPAEYNFTFSKEASNAIYYTSGKTITNSGDSTHSAYQSTSGSGNYYYSQSVVETAYREGRKPILVQKSYDDEGNGNAKGYGVCLTKVGYYNGNWIDVKGEIVDYRINNDRTDVGAYPVISFSNKVPSVTVLGMNYIRTKWTFYKTGSNCGGNQTSVKGFTSYWDVDQQQGIGFTDSTNTGLYVPTNSSVLYKTTVESSAGNTYQYVYDVSEVSSETDDKNYAVTETFNGSSIDRLFSFVRYSGGDFHNSNGTITLSGESSSIVETPNKPIKKVSETETSTKLDDLDITHLVYNGNKSFTYTVTQDVPMQHPEYYYNKFEFTDTLEAPLIATNIVVKDDEGNNVTNRFTTSVGQTVKATATTAAMNSASFYGGSYQFIITAKLKDNVTSEQLRNFIKGTIFEVPNKGTVTYQNKGDSSQTANNTNTVTVRWYRGNCPDGTLECDPDIKPKKTVSTKYTNDITTFDYRVSQLVPALPTDKSYKWTSLSLIDTIDRAFDMTKTVVKIIDTRYGDKDVTSDFNVTINDHTITASAKETALNTEEFYGTTYEMVISTKVTEGFDFAGYEQTKENCSTVEGQEICDPIYTIINNKATRIFKNKFNNEYTAETNQVPTTHVNPKMPSKAVDTEMIRAEKDFHYTIEQKVQPATEENYYDSFVFTDVLEPPLQIRKTSDVKITQITLDTEGNEVSRKDYTNNFDITLSGDNNNTIIAKAKLDVLKTADFYGTREENTDKEALKKYEFELTVSLRDNAENIMDMSKYIDGMRYKIPNIANFTTKTPGNEEIKKNTNEVQVYYYPDPAPEKTVSQENITSLYNQDKSFIFSIKKRILAYDENIWYKSFEFKDTLEDCFEIAAPSALVIKNEAGIVVTSWFDVKVDGQTISATLKSGNNNENFYGHTYSFDITTKVKKGFDLSKWKQGEQYVIPNEGKFIYDNKTEIKTNIREVYINIPNLTVKVPNTLANLPIYIKVIGCLLLLCVAGIGIYIYKGGNIKTLLKKNK